MVSTRGRYALRVMTDLAENRTGGYLPMKEVAARQGLSLKYLERILPLLTKGGLIEGAQGKGGGYRLTRDPSDIRVYDVLTLTEEDLAPVACLADGARTCERRNECRTLPMWQGFYDLTKNYFSSVTVADLMKDGAPDMYVI